MAKLFARLIASLDHGPFDQTRVRIVGRPGAAFVHVDDWSREHVLDEWREDTLLLRLTPDEARSLAAFLTSAVAAIKQEGG